MTSRAGTEITAGIRPKFPFSFFWPLVNSLHHQINVLSTNEVTNLELKMRLFVLTEKAIPLTWKASQNFIPEHPRA